MSRDNVLVLGRAKLNPVPPLRGKRKSFFCGHHHCDAGLVSRSREKRQVKKELLSELMDDEQAREWAERRAQTPEHQGLREQVLAYLEAGEIPADVQTYDLGDLKERLRRQR